MASRASSSLGEDTYRLTLESPIGKIRPEVRIVEQRPGEHQLGLYLDNRWRRPGRRLTRRRGGCVVSYTGEFHLKRKLLDRAARLVGAEQFARTNGERSLSRLKYLMEARRY